MHCTTFHEPIVANRRLSIASNSDYIISVSVLLPV